jgi:hypothetical protein
MNRFLRMSVLCLAVILASCKDENSSNPVTPDDPFSGLTLIAAVPATGSGCVVELWSKEKIVTGYNALIIAVKDSTDGRPVNDAVIRIMPMMDMGTMKHSAPCEHPTGNETKNGLYACAVVFTMSSTGGQWSVTVSVDRSNVGKSGSAILPVSVSDPPVLMMKAVTTLNDSARIYVSLVQRKKPSVGINPFEITIHRRASMMSFPPDSSYTVTITPEMPSMGHGSPNNVNPIHDGAGHYRGTVNFTMTGEWRISLNLFKNSAAADTTLYFDITL